MLGKLQKSLKVVIFNKVVEGGVISTILPERHSRRVWRNKKRTRREFQIDTQIADFQIKENILDLGFDVNILLRKTWEPLGRPKLKFSPIQLHMENQYCILSIGRLEGMEVDIVGVKKYADFEVIGIMGDKEPYLTLLEIYWAFENYDIIDLNKEIMTFGVEGVRVIQPLDPYQGPRFTELTDDNEELGLLDQLYRLIIGRQEDYINPTAKGSIKWQSIQSSEVGTKVAWDVL